MWLNKRAETAANSFATYMNTIQNFFTLPRPTTVTVLADPVRLVAQGWRPWQPVGDRGICPRLASGPLRHAQCGLGLGGRQEWGRPWTEDHRRGSTQAWLD